MLNLTDMDLPQLAEHIASFGEKPYRAKQVLSWVYGKYASTWDEMTDLPAALRKCLAETARVRQLELLRKQEGEGDWAKRFLWGKEGKPLCESVLLSYKYGLTGCVSSQAGCPVGCGFCASAVLGFERNLSAGEIIEEFLGMCQDQGERIGHIVFMGTGEPFMNYDNVLLAIERLCDPALYGLSRRKVTVSTVGVPHAMDRYAKDCKGARLALSLHATDNETRDKLIPLNKRYPLEAVLSALKRFSTNTGQRVTIEYMLLRDVNDRAADASRLASMVKGLDCLVNLIPWNEVPGLKWKSPEPARVAMFREALEGNRVKVTIRRRLGANIEAACGQRRREAAVQPHPENR